MKIRIFDYNDKMLEVDIGNKKIETITVIVLSGDELATVEFADGTKANYDSGTQRIFDFFDGGYCLIDDNEILKWLEYPKKHTDNISYCRLEEFII